MEMLVFSFGAFLARSVEEFARGLGTRGSTNRGGTIHRGNSIQCIRKRTITNSVKHTRTPPALGKAHATKGRSNNEKTS